MKFIKYWKPLLIALIICYASVTSGSNINKVNFLHFKNSDKLLHFAMYLLLAITFLASLIKHSPFKRKTSFLISFILVVSYGLIMEIFQFYLTEDRTADVMDALANTFGVISGMLILPLIEKTIFIKYL